MYDFYVFLPSCGTVKSVSLFTWFRFAYHPFFRCTEKRGKIFSPSMRRRRREGRRAQRSRGE